MHWSVSTLVHGQQSQTSPCQVVWGCILMCMDCTVVVVEQSILAACMRTTITLLHVAISIMFSYFL